jgi:hypothetical protein
MYDRNPKGIHELRQFLLEEVAKITPEECYALAHSMRRRAEAVIAANGCKTAY